MAKSSASGTDGYAMIGRTDKVSGVISAAVPSLKYDSGSGEATGIIDVYNENITITAENFNDGYKTAYSVAAGETIFVENKTEYIDIKGVGGETVHRVDFLNPLFPMQTN